MSIGKTIKKLHGLIDEGSCTNPEWEKWLMYLNAAITKIKKKKG